VNRHHIATILQPLGAGDSPAGCDIRYRRRGANRIKELVFLRVAPPKLSRKLVFWDRSNISLVRGVEISLTWMRSRHSPRILAGLSRFQRSRAQGISLQHTSVNQQICETVSPLAWDPPYLGSPGMAKINTNTGRIDELRIEKIDRVEPLLTGGKDFFTERSIEQLAEIQGVKPLKNPKTFAGAWPADQDVDAFLEEIYSSR
jgi:hypothetical protein